MADLNAIGGDNRTPQTFWDFAKPTSIEEGDRLFRRLTLGFGGKDVDANEMAAKLAEVIKGTNTFNVEEIWGRFEKIANKGKPVPTKVEGGYSQLTSIFGMFYSAINTVDQGTSALDLRTLKAFYQDARGYIDRRILPNIEGKDKSLMERTMKTLDNRLGAVVKRFNGMIEEGLIYGPPIQ